MKRIIASLLLVAGLALNSCQHTGGGAAVGGWQIGLQTWTLRNMTFFEAVSNANVLGIHCIEAFPGQKLGDGLPGSMHHNMDAAVRAQVLDKLKDYGATLVSYGVVNGKDDAEWQQIFEFAKGMKLRSISSEPAPEQLDLVAKLADRNGINVAFHNHPEPSRYWNPDTVLAAVKGRTRRLGACADTGHWVRSGLDPVESLKKLQGRIVTLHFKDLNKKTKDAHDMPWGTGISNAPGMFAELRRQGFKGVILIEYEHQTLHLLDDVRKCVEYFNEAAPLTGVQLRSGKALVPGMSWDIATVHASPTINTNQWPTPYEFEPLFAKDLANATFPAGSWKFDNGVLTATGGGDIWTKEKYGNFVLELDFKCETNTNSGVFLRCANIQNWLHTSIEVQILQTDEEDKKHNCGAIFDCLAPTKQMVKPPGEWNHYVITAQDNKIEVVLNGEKVLDMNLDQWTEAHKNPDGTPNKFNMAYKDMPRTGFVGLQYHGHPVWFRNLKIKKQ